MSHESGQATEKTLEELYGQCFAESTVCDEIFDRMRMLTEALKRTEAELAKAWEAAIEAAASTVIDSGTGLLPGVALERIAAAVRTLQPPGGKAK